MKYRTVNKHEAEAAFEYLTKCVGEHSLVEIKKVSAKRSNPQNRYLHLIIGAFSVHFGYTLEEGKQVYKMLNRDIYVYEKNGRTFYRSSKDLTVEEMAKSVDKFREASASNGYELPLATDQDWLVQIDNAIEQAKYYL